MQKPRKWKATYCKSQRKNSQQRKLSTARVSQRSREGVRDHLPTASKGSWTSPATYIAEGMVGRRAIQRHSAITIGDGRKVTCQEQLTWGPCGRWTKKVLIRIQNPYR